LFVGKFQNSIDAKGRCIIPAKFRRDLGDSCVIFKAFDYSINLFPTESWEVFVEEHVESRPDEDIEAEEFKFLVYSNASECEIDAQGRINIPKEFQEHAGITKELITMGHRSRVQIWSKEKYDERIANLGDKGRELYSKMGRYIDKPGTK
jgi:MraZ protein